MIINLVLLYSRSSGEEIGNIKYYITLNILTKKINPEKNPYVIGSRLYLLALYITFFHNTVMFLTMGTEKYLVWAKHHKKQCGEKIFLRSSLSSNTTLFAYVSRKKSPPHTLFLKKKINNFCFRLFTNIPQTFCLIFRIFIQFVRNFPWKEFILSISCICEANMYSWS